MKITGFCPIIVTKDQESVVKTFEALGFERRHRKNHIAELMEKALQEDSKESPCLH